MLPAMTKWGLTWALDHLPTDGRVGTHSTMTDRARDTEQCWGSFI